MGRSPSNMISKSVSYLITPSFPSYQNTLYSHDSKKPAANHWNFPISIPVTCNYRQLAKLVAVDWFGLMDADAGRDADAPPWYFIAIYNGARRRLNLKLNDVDFLNANLVKI